MCSPAALAATPCLAARIRTSSTSNSIKDSIKGSNRDQIKDFKHSQGDKIDLRDIPGKFKWIGTDDFSDKKGELRYEDKGSKVIVQGDTNGDGKADFEIYVSAGSLSKGDFVF